MDNGVFANISFLHDLLSQESLLSLEFCKLSNFKSPHGLNSLNL